MKILVTGGAGFIGSHVTEALLVRGDEVVCFDNFNDYHSPTRKRKNLAPFLSHSDALGENPSYLLYEQDISNTHRLLDHKPKASLEEGLPRFVEWFRSHRDTWRARGENCLISCPVSLSISLSEGSAGPDSSPSAWW